MSSVRSVASRNNIPDLSEWVAWLDRMATAIFGISGAEFEAAFRSGAFVDSGPASDLGSVIPLIARLRERHGKNAV
jgi:hypothetical protein